MVDTLALQHDEQIKLMGDTTPLIIDIVEQIKTNGAVRPNVTSSYCQTEDVGNALIASICPDTSAGTRPGMCTGTSIQLADVTVAKILLVKLVG